jgi:hypothetical protein
MPPKRSKPAPSPALDRTRSGSRSVADELATELRMTRHAAHTRIAVAQALLTRMPCLLAAMDAGELDEHKARQAADATAPLPDDLARKVDTIVATRHRHQTSLRLAHLPHPGHPRPRPRRSKPAPPPAAKTATSR